MLGTGSTCPFLYIMYWVMNMHRVAVLYGGISEEREISHKSGLAVARALVAKGYLVYLLDTKDDDWVSVLIDINPDAVFIALHGRFGEDGKIQGLLESLHIPYTGAGVRGSIIAMDKLLSKYFFKEAGFKVPKFFPYASFHLDTIGDVEFQYPMIVKPRYGGSTIGLHIVSNGRELKSALDYIRGMGDEPIIEEFIKGRELTLGVYKNRHGKLVTLPLIEIVYNAEIFDYQTKYTAGAARHVIPAPIPREIYRELETKIPIVWESMTLDGVVRFDFILREDELYVLEVNTIPGMTEVSLVPDAARHKGIPFEDLVEDLILSASYGKP